MSANEDLMSDLINTVEQGKHRQFQFLKSWQEYRRAKMIRRTYALLVASISQSARRQFSNYCKAIKAGNTEVIKLLAYCTTIKVQKFYDEELRILSDMIDEYECYLADGNWWDFVFNSKRQLDKMFDHRGR